MTRATTVAVACTALLWAGQAGAQDVPTADGDSASVVVVSEKSPVAAGVLEWVFPTIGYAYAGNWTRGLPSGLVRITGAVLIVSQQFVIFGEPPPCRDECVAGAIMLVGGTVWAIIDAGRTASKENERRRASLLGASVAPTFGPAGAGLAFRVPIG